ncbi:MazG nucleotide pyrophosphohydrolase domain-containing protein [Ruficoccus sp. ZRK36]|uniref:MazG nucleotide pyrophosphohydrolase domain-containing protein n=1 Tax=Ruficoccus sp. ZRK36 TaxID=2866311 RepID=UPI001C736A7C|nr:MazG nucleotide pyrophosphohydrolase domain-containing protein [Ruficoccus sp. ZRK36]QYY35287.1 hypothetical protein K0V07_13420 [Ruficoccus sp. ZRK36]
MSTQPLTFSQLAAANLERGLEWTGKNRAELEFSTIEMCGEAGEVADAVKKFLRAQRGMKGGIEGVQALRAIGEELADVVICAERVADSLGLDLGECVRNKFNQTSEKHGFKTRLS